MPDIVVETTHVAELNKTFFKFQTEFHHGESEERRTSAETAEHGHSPEPAESLAAVSSTESEPSKRPPIKRIDSIGGMGAHEGAYFPSQKSPVCMNPQGDDWNGTSFERDDYMADHGHGRRPSDQGKNFFWQIPSFSLFVCLFHL